MIALKVMIGGDHDYMEEIGNSSYVVAINGDCISVTIGDECVKFIDGGRWRQMPTMVIIRYKLTVKVVGGGSAEGSWW